MLESLRRHDERAHLDVRRAQRLRRRAVHRRRFARERRARAASACRAAASPGTPAGAENDRRKTARPRGTSSVARSATPGSRCADVDAASARRREIARARRRRRAAARAARAAHRASRIRRPGSIGPRQSTSSMTSLAADTARGRCRRRRRRRIRGCRRRVAACCPGCAARVETRLGGERRDRPAAKFDGVHRDPRRQLADGLGDERGGKRVDRRAGSRTRRARAFPRSNSTIRSTNE